MKIKFRQNQLYTFLIYCDNETLDKTILDCGAGGNMPPLAMFKEYGFDTTGIEISKQAIERAKEFEKVNDVDLNIIEGDMTHLPFDDESFSYVYSYNAVFHMKKEEIAQSIAEMKRVVKKDGLVFVNLLTVDDGEFGKGEKIGEGEYLQGEHGGTVIHSYFEHDEAEKYFEGFEVIYKEVRLRNRYWNDEWVTIGFVDYILQKK